MTLVDLARRRAPIIALGWLLLAGLTFSLAAPADASAIPHSPHPRTSVLNAVAFVDARHGWVAGDHGEIMATSNAGLTWMFQHGSGPAITSLDFVDRLHGWAVAGSRILRTVDGGLNWRSHKAPGSGLSSVQFVGPSNGWALGKGTTPAAPLPFYFTHDGGRTWHTSRYQFDGMCRIDAQHGWVIGGRTVFQLDSGSRWPTFTHPTRLPGVLGTHWAGSIECDNTSVWVLLRGEGGASNQGPAVALRSLDSGATWRPVLTEGYFPSLPQRLSLRVAGQITGYAGVFASVGTSAFFSVSCSACSASDSVSVTRDAGSSFSSRKIGIGLPQQTAPMSISFTDPQHGWLAVQWTGGSHPESDLLRTTDGGTTWQAVYPSYRAPQALPSGTAGPIAVPETANRLVAADGSIWAASDRLLMRIDPSTNAATCQVRIVVQGLAAGGGSIWVVAGHGVTRIDAATCRVSGHYLGPSKNRRVIAVGDGAIWVIPALGHRLLRIDQATGAVTRLPGFPVDEVYTVEAGAGSLWGWSQATSRLYRIDLATGRVANPKGIEMGGRSATIAMRGGLLWAVGSNGILLKFDAASGQRLASFRLRDLDSGGGYTAAPGARALWVFANATGDQRVMKVDPSTGRIIRWEFASGQGFAAAFGSRWVTTDSPVVRFR